MAFTRIYISSCKDAEKVASWLNREFSKRMPSQLTGVTRLFCSHGINMRTKLHEQNIRFNHHIVYTTFECGVYNMELMKKIAETNEGVVCVVLLDDISDLIGQCLSKDINSNVQFICFDIITKVEMVHIF